MKKISVKKVLICLSIIFFLVWGLFIYAVDVIKIDPLKFVSTMRIQQIHLYYRLTKTDNGLEKDDIVKAWLKNEWWKEMWVLYVRPVDVTDTFVDETNNTIAHPDEASIIGGQENTNLWYETTMILWWSRNTADWQWVTLMGWDNNTALVDNAVILGSANSTVWAPNWIVMSSDWWTVNWKNSTMFWWWWTITQNAENSFWISMWGQLEQKWVFLAWNVNVLKPNIVALNIWEWLIVKWTKPNWSSKIQLTVNGALAVGYWKCSDNMVWAVYYVPAETDEVPPKPAYCLCSCAMKRNEDHTDKIIRPMALSNQPYCDGICNWEWWSGPECWTRWLKDSHLIYEYWETDWRVASNYCRDNTMPISSKHFDKDWNEITSDRCTATLDESCVENPNQPQCACDPEFLEAWETLEWVCKGVWFNDRVNCGAHKKVAPPVKAVCGENANKYVLYSDSFLGDWAGNFCYWWDPDHPDNRSENAVPIAYKILTEEQIKNGITWEYITGNITDYEAIVEQLNNTFIPEWWRTFWKCATTNADIEVIEWAEVVSEQECYAERMPCNYCGTSGFPYCFDVDFGSWCEEWVWSSDCMPWEDNHWPFHPLYDSWDSTSHVDTMFANESWTKVLSKPDYINVTFERDAPDHYYAKYTFSENTSPSIRTWIVHWGTDDGYYCKEWDVYLIQCSSWYVLEDWWHKCIEKKCQGDVPKHAVPANNIKVDNIDTYIFLATWDDLNKACAYKCDEGYTYLWWAEPFCAKCAEDWVVNVDMWWCEFTEKEDCDRVKPPYDWFEDLGKCALPWTCKGYQEPLSIMNELYKDIRPMANKYNQEIDAYCVDKDVAHESHQCIYTCNEANWYLCVNGSCVKPECHWNSSTEWTDWDILNQYIEGGALYWAAKDHTNYLNRDFVMNTNKAYRAFRQTDKYRNLNTSLKNWETAVSYWFDIAKAVDINAQNTNSSNIRVYKNPSLYDERWFFVEAKDETAFRTKTSGLAWCFYWCTWADLHTRLIDENNKKYISYECWSWRVINHWWGGGWNTSYTPSNLVYLCKGNKSIKWPYDYSQTWWEKTETNDPSYSYTWEYKKSSEPCHFRCEDGYEHVEDSNGNHTCWKKCGTWEYVRDLQCLSCPTWYIPTTWDDEKDENGNPTGCWKKCKNSEKAIDGLCYSCGIGRKWKFGKNAKLDKHGNATECEDICADWETFWTAVDPNDCWWADTCCLPTTLNWHTRCDDGDKDCSRDSKGKCICRTNVDF